MRKKMLIIAALAALTLWAGFLAPPPARAHQHHPPPAHTTPHSPPAGGGVYKSKTFCTLWHDLTSGSSDSPLLHTQVSQAIFPFPCTSSSVRFNDRTLVGTFCY
jgi:hypothetical protein